MSEENVELEQTVEQMNPDETVRKITKAEYTEYEKCTEPVLPAHLAEIENAIMKGKYEFVEEGTQEEPPDVQEPVQDAAESDEEDIKKEQYLKAVAEAEKKKEEEYQQKLKEQEEENLRLQREKEELIKTRQINQEIENKYADIDDEFLNDNEKILKQRLIDQEKEIQRLKELKAQSDPRLDEYFRQQEIEKARREADAADAAIVNELSRLVDAAPTIGFKGDVKKAYGEYVNFAERVAQEFNIYKADGSIDQESLTRIETAYLDKFDGGETYNRINSRGIVPPNEFREFLKVADYYNKSRGIECDRVTGQVKSYQLSPEEIYWLENKDSILANERKQEQLKIAGKLQRRDNSAITINPNETATANEIEIQSDKEFYEDTSDAMILQWKKTRDPRYEKIIQIENAIRTGKIR
jgi:hypothetical protein